METDTLENVENVLPQLPKPINASQSTRDFNMGKRCGVAIEEYLVSDGKPFFKLNIGKLGNRDN